MRNQTRVVIAGTTVLVLILSILSIPLVLKRFESDRNSEESQWVYQTERESDRQSDSPSQTTSRPRSIKNWLNKKATPILQKFEDHKQTALHAPRLALSGHINKLQAARREWENLSPNNVYMKVYKKLVLSYMNNQITALTNFMAEDTSEIPLQISQYEKAMAGDYLYHVLKKFNLDYRKIKGPTITTFSNRQFALKKINTWQKMFRSEGGRFIRTLGSGVMDRQLEKMDRIEKYIKNGPWIFDADEQIRD